MARSLNGKQRMEPKESRIVPHKYEAPYKKPLKIWRNERELVDAKIRESLKQSLFS